MMRKILIVEDDYDVGTLLTSVLEKAGYHVDCVNSGCPVVNHQCGWPDLFIIDKKMELIDGFALCKFLRLNERTKVFPLL